MPDIPISTFIDVTVNLQGAVADTFNFGVPMVVDEHTVTVNRQDGPYTSLAAAVAAGFTQAATPEIYEAVGQIFAQTPTVSSVMIGRRDAGDADLTASLDAIFADDPTTWYCTVITTRTDTDVEDLADWHQTNGGGDFPKIAIAQTSSAAMLAGTPGNIGETLRTASYNRCALIYHATDATALDAAWVGRCLAFDLDGVNSVGDWAYKRLSGPTGDGLTSAQVNNVQTENASFFGPAKGLTFTFDGKMPIGAPQFIDTITTADWVKVRSQEAFLSARVGATTMIPFDDPGIQYLGGKFQEVADRGVTAGHFLGERSGAPNPEVIVPLLKDVSATDQANRNIRVTMNVLKRNSILTCNLTINIGLTGV